MDLLVELGPALDPGARALEIIVRGPSSQAAVTVPLRWLEFPVSDCLPGPGTGRSGDGRDLPAAAVAEAELQAAGHLRARAAPAPGLGDRGHPGGSGRHPPRHGLADSE